MEIAKKLKVNEPNVVHETIDGETILLDLNTGNYFSLDGPGAIIWEFIEGAGEWDKLFGFLKSKDPEKNKNIQNSVAVFVADLVRENLLVEKKDDSPRADTTELEDKLRAVVENFTPPRVNKYSDMQDLLLLDPIHEVDEKGWPESKDATENN